jgi:hypothetical protein
VAYVIFRCYPNLGLKYGMIVSLRELEPIELADRSFATKRTGAELLAGLIPVRPTYVASMLQCLHPLLSDGIDQGCLLSF